MRPPRGRGTAARLLRRRDWRPPSFPSPRTHSTDTGITTHDTCKSYGPRHRCRPLPSPPTRQNTTTSVVQCNVHQLSMHSRDIERAPLFKRTIQSANEVARPHPYQARQRDRTRRRPSFNATFINSRCIRATSSERRCSSARFNPPTRSPGRPRTKPANATNTTTSVVQRNVHQLSMHSRDIERASLIKRTNSTPQDDRNHGLDILGRMKPSPAVGLPTTTPASTATLASTISPRLGPNVHFDARFARSLAPHASASPPAGTWCRSRSR
jgi:hypothetical protein